MIRLLPAWSCAFKPSWDFDLCVVLGILIVVVRLCIWCVVCCPSDSFGQFAFAMLGPRSASLGVLRCSADDCICCDMF